MPEITPSPQNIPDSAEVTENAEALDAVEGQVPAGEDALLEIELEDELIIEDFTIDGICGVY